MTEAGYRVWWRQGVGYGGGGVEVWWRWSGGMVEVEWMYGVAGGRSWDISSC